MMTDWAAVRASFPATTSCCYLNTAAGGPISEAAAAAGSSYYDATVRDGDVHWDEWLDRVESVRGSVARLIQAHSHEIGFTNNASSALNLVARKLLGTGSCSPFVVISPPSHGRGCSSVTRWISWTPMTTGA
ncbi:MAG TPA: aminotransferase class V-fold PLP-dependent enzyme [Acidobacteriota bacterium]|nr:aminotransferase class V-fold PLP-dependent enzyme [Acidobacteriota bacterium]